MFNSKLKPVGVRLIIDADVDRTEKVTGSGLIIPVGAQRTEYATSGKVIAAGPECTDISAGDNVIWAKYSGAKYKFKGGTSVTVMNEGDILAIVSEEVANGDTK